MTREIVNEAMPSTRAEIVARAQHATGRQILIDVRPDGWTIYYTPGMNLERELDDVVRWMDRPTLDIEADSNVRERLRKAMRDAPTRPPPVIGSKISWEDLDMEAKGDSTARVVAFKTRFHMKRSISRAIAWVKQPWVVMALLAIAIAAVVAYRLWGR